MKKIDWFDSKIQYIEGLYHYYFGLSACCHNASKDLYKFRLNKNYTPLKADYAFRMATIEYEAIFICDLWRFGSFNGMRWDCDTTYGQCDMWKSAIHRHSVSSFLCFASIFIVPISYLKVSYEYRSDPKKSVKNINFLKFPFALFLKIYYIDENCLTIAAQIDRWRCTTTESRRWPFACRTGKHLSSLFLSSLLRRFTQCVLSAPKQSRKIILVGDANHLWTISLDSIDLIFTLWVECTNAKLYRETSLTLGMLNSPLLLHLW